MTTPIELAVNIDDNGTFSIEVHESGRYLLVIGDEAATFDSGSIAVQQHGIVLSNAAGTALSAITAAARHDILNIAGGDTVDLVVTSVAGAVADINAKLIKLPDGILSQG